MRKMHYGFTVDDGPFYHTQVGSEFGTCVKISGDYKSRFDQMALVVRKDKKPWLKAGVEFVDNPTSHLPDKRRMDCLKQRS